MAATYTWDVFTTLDGFGSFASGAGWGGYWSMQGPELLERRAALHRRPQRMVLGGTTFRETARMLAAIDDADLDEWNLLMRATPTTVVSNGADDALGWPDATFLRGDAVEGIARLKEESDVPLRSHGSLSLNRALLGAGLVDRVQLTIFPVLTGRTGTSPVLHDMPDATLELLESRILDGRTIEVVHRPTLRPGPA